MKVLATIVIICAGAIPGGLLTLGGSSSHLVESQGVVIDFGGMNVRWTDADLDTYDTGISVLEHACSVNGYPLVKDDDAITGINGVMADSEHFWKYWGISSGSTDWHIIDSHSDPSDYTVTSWAYCRSDETPSIGVDALGNSIYGYGHVLSAVSMSPSTTEIFGAIDIVDILVGVDQYSNYPDSVNRGKSSGSIEVIGGYTNPSFEMILSTKPDLVFGDESQYIHADTCRKLIDNGVDAVLLYNGVDIQTIMNNIFIVGQATGNGDRASSVIGEIRTAIDEVADKIHQSPQSSESRVLIALSNDRSPWASGAGTYADDVIESIGGDNVVDGKRGWVQISSEVIAKSNPEFVVIISSRYHATQSDYDAMLSQLSLEWKSTDAYENGRIYLLCDGAVDLASRSSPRVAQLTELFGRIIQPDVFTDIVLPKFIGDDYNNYLTITKDYNYNN